MQINKLNQNRGKRQHLTDNDKKIADTHRLGNTEEKKMLASRKQTEQIANIQCSMLKL